MTIPSVISPKRFYVRCLPTTWPANSDEISWKLFECISEIALIDNIAVVESKPDNFYGVVDVLRRTDADKLLKHLDEQSRFYIPSEKCYLEVQHQKSIEKRIVYSRVQILELREFAVLPPQLPPFLDAQIVRRR
ncbi:hypothetical protein DdX_02140 [Ditylenchus destructor]|uniref:Uncharacterized protein n=1 Tax=Ditylenchus destructor TaxID=166010 RepID=A0AAD4NH33_9BILA|nr:hypothetical protein DdX_02140 [Ditylenchus destructor]